jgi:hypothetical protein
MRKATFFILFTSCLFCFTAVMGQIDVKLNPIGLLFNSPDVSVDYILNEQLSVELLAGVDYGVVFGSGLLNRANRLTKSGLRIRLLGKYYFETDKGGDTWYAGVYVGPRWRTVTPDEDNVTNPGWTQATLTSGIHGGYKFILNSNIIFDLGLGLGRTFSDRIRSQNPTSGAVISSIGLDSFVRLEMGYRF